MTEDEPEVEDLTEDIAHLHREMAAALQQEIDELENLKLSERTRYIATQRELLRQHREAQEAAKTGKGAFQTPNLRYRPRVETVQEQEGLMSEEELDPGIEDDVPDFLDFDLYYDQENPDIEALQDAFAIRPKIPKEPKDMERDPRPKPERKPRPELKPTPQPKPKPRPQPKPDGKGEKADANHGTQTEPEGEGSESEPEGDVAGSDSDDSQIGGLYYNDSTPARYAPTR